MVGLHLSGKRHTFAKRADNEQIGLLPQGMIIGKGVCSESVPLKQACHLDIFMKTQGKKTKTQELKTKNSRVFAIKTKILSNFYNFNAQIFQRSKFLGIFNLSCQYFSKSCPKTQGFSQNSREISKKNPQYSDKSTNL